MHYNTRSRSNRFHGGYLQVSEAALGSFEELSLDFMPEEEGIMMIYTANQTAEDLDVYMDDMLVLHTEGPIIRESPTTGKTTMQFTHSQPQPKIAYPFP